MNQETAKRTPSRMKAKKKPKTKKNKMSKVCFVMRWSKWGSYSNWSYKITIFRCVSFIAKVHLHKYNECDNCINHMNVLDPLSPHTPLLDCPKGDEFQISCRPFGECVQTAHAALKHISLPFFQNSTVDKLCLYYFGTWDNPLPVYGYRLLMCCRGVFVHGCWLANAYLSVREWAVNWIRTQQEMQL